MTLFSHHFNPSMQMFPVRTLFSLGFFLDYEMITISGQIIRDADGENLYALFIGDNRHEPIVKILNDLIANKVVTVRYWITDKECTKEDAIEDNLKILMGVADTEYSSHYSETTGYLYTDEKLNVGGHDLLAELWGYVGKYIILEIEIHDMNEVNNMSKTNE